MSLVRTVLPECLDSLSPMDPAAVRARNDLRRVHRVMGIQSILLAALRPWAHADRAAPLRVLELGAGDGQLLLGVARALGPAWAPVELTLLDRQALLDPATRAAYAALGWSAREQVCDVHDWAADIGRSAPVRLPPARWDLIVANLFLHHFEGAPLVRLLAAIATGGERFLACEPRRSRVGLMASGLIGAIGVGAVTRTDAVLSVHAGFAGDEITRLWPPAPDDWITREYAAGRFSHCFVATRASAAGNLSERRTAGRRWN